MAAENDNWVVVAHNDSFERCIEESVLAPRYGWPTVPLERHRCTMAAALAYGLPGSLDKAAKASGLEKDIAGQKLMRTMCQPVLDPSKYPGETVEHNGLIWRDSPSLRARLAEYCKKDTEVEREIHRRVGFLSDAEQQLWVLDQRTNDFGVFVDVDFARAANNIATSIFAGHAGEIAGLTNGMVRTPSQVSKIRQWLEAKGCPLSDLRKGTVADTLALGGLDPVVERVLDIRREGSLRSSLKYAKMLSWVGDDGRVRGLLNFHGAHTGRWTSYGPQIHNFKKPPKSGMTRAVDIVASGDLSTVAEVYSRPIRIVYDVARAMVAAAPGNEFISADFSGIESRVTAWIAGEAGKVAQWAKFDKTQDPMDEPYLRIGLSCGLAPETARRKGKIIDLAFGYAGGLGAYRAMDRKGKDSDATIKAYQSMWRGMHPQVVKLWCLLEGSAIHAVKNPGLIIRCGDRLAWACAGDFLYLRLPSGRCFVYPFPRIEWVGGREVLVYKTMFNGNFSDCGRGKGIDFRPGTYGGKIFENLVQAIARDLLAEAMVRLSKAGFDIPIHVHDEILAEVPVEFNNDQSEKATRENY